MYTGDCTLERLETISELRDSFSLHKGSVPTLASASGECMRRRFYTFPSKATKLVGFSTNTPSKDRRASSIDRVANC